MFMGMGQTELLMVMVPIILFKVVPWVLSLVLLVLAIRWFLRQERERRDPKTVAVRRSLSEVLRECREARREQTGRVKVGAGQVGAVDDEPREARGALWS